MVILLVSIYGKIVKLVISIFWDVIKEKKESSFLKIS